MTGQRVLMFVGAHPDDESFGPGGTLAKYATEGVRVVYACATRGEAGTVDPEQLGGFATLADKRWAELQCAARALRLAKVTHLGYRDSGMPGWPDNRHPDALAAAALESVTRDVVAAMRHLRPQVVMTFDPIGGYRHPDHIAIHQATVRAFHLAGDPQQFPSAGLPFAPQKLYYWIPSRTVLRLAVRALRILGRDPSRRGRNGDVDLAGVAAVDFPIHARIRVPRNAMARKHAAAVCHRSQVGSYLVARRLAWLLSRCVSRTDLYMRAHPRPAAEGTETDLFDGVV
jgi:LmbE family N-acetylglucosaminyl deacetylase